MGHVHVKFADERPRALVMEYDPWERECALEALATAGFCVVGVSNGASGLRMLEHLRFDVILVDLQLPEVRGWQVLQELRKAGSSCWAPVILIGAVFSAEHALAEGLLGKPLEDSRVVEEVGRVLMRHAAPRESNTQPRLRDAGLSRSHVSGDALHPQHIVKGPAQRPSSPAVLQAPVS
jgi:DNA-binding response OmpR family regulator